MRVFVAIVIASWLICGLFMTLAVKADPPPPAHHYRHMPNYSVIDRTEIYAI